MKIFEKILENNEKDVRITVSSCMTRAFPVFGERGLRGKCQNVPKLAEAACDWKSNFVDIRHAWVGWFL